jgi:hypothetical protein
MRNNIQPSWRLVTGRGKYALKVTVSDRTIYLSEGTIQAMASFFENNKGLADEDERFSEHVKSQQNERKKEKKD